MESDSDLQIAAAFAFSQIKRNYASKMNSNNTQSQILQNAEQYVLNGSMSQVTSKKSVDLSLRKKTSGGKSRLELIWDDSCPRRVSQQPKTQLFGTKMGTRRKVVDWEINLSSLSQLYSSLSNETKCTDEIRADLCNRFQELNILLCSASVSQRSFPTFASVEIYAGNLVCENVVSSTIKNVLIHWLEGMQGNFNQYDQVWLHTRAVITQMLRNIIIQDYLLITTRDITQLLNTSTGLILENQKHNKYGHYANEQLEYFLTVLMHQAANVIC